MTLFEDRLRECRFSEEQIAKIQDIINHTCTSCWDGYSSCQCWNDE